MLRDDGCAYLVVGEELYACVGEDAEEGGGVAFEQAADAVLGVDVAQGMVETRPLAGVFQESGIAGLEENLDAVERADYCFPLRCLC